MRLSSKTSQEFLLVVAFHGAALLSAGCFAHREPESDGVPGAQVEAPAEGQAKTPAASAPAPSAEAAAPASPAAAETADAPGTEAAPSPSPANEAEAQTEAESPALPHPPPSVASATAPSDGLSTARMVFLLPPEQYEARAKKECAQRSTSPGCTALYMRAAYRLRWNVDAASAPTLLAYACEHKHATSCAALSVLSDASAHNIAVLRGTACPQPTSNEACFATWMLLAHTCNDRHQAASCTALADLLASGDKSTGDKWVQHYRERACTLGGPCASSPPEAAAGAAEGESGSSESESESDSGGSDEEPGGEADE